MIDLFELGILEKKNPEFLHQILKFRMSSWKEKTLQSENCPFQKTFCNIL